MSATSAPQSLHIGTSGWHYDHWAGPFYPEDAPSGEWLDFYASSFSSVELNNTFYQLPEESTLEEWKEQTPPDFLFAAKASRYITHMKKLKDPKPSVRTFFERMRALQPKLGAVLFQLPPNWRFNQERLAEFLAALPTGHRYAFELWGPSWINPHSLDMLHTHQSAFCIYEFDGRIAPKEVTADFVYIRLHGPGEAYEGHYDPSTLSGWAGAISSWLRAGKEVFCFFDNDQAGHAPQNALRLQEMLDAGP